ncbi:MAG TPA: hypothetical protein VGF14_02820 [Alphaproteobacteria bacterium]
MHKTTPHLFAQSMMASLDHFPLMLDYYRPTKNSAEILKRREQFNSFQSRVAHAENDHDTSKIMFNQFIAAGRWIDRHHRNLVEPRPLNMGFQALVYQVGSVVLRFQPSLVTRVHYRQMLPNTWNYMDPSTKFTCELTPPVDMSNITKKDTLTLKEVCRKDGYHYSDPTIYNQGWYKASHWRNPEQVVVDPGSLSPIQKPLIIAGPT